MTDFFIPTKKTSDLWYREPWMLLVLGGPAIVVIAGLITFYIAWQGKDNVLTRDYYKQGINIDKAIHQDTQAAAYQMLANIKIDHSGKIDLQLEAKIKLPESTLLSISSYSRGSEFEKIQTVTLNRTTNGNYEGSIKTISPRDLITRNVWHIKITGPDWRLMSDWHDPLNSALILNPIN